MVQVMQQHIQREAIQDRDRQLESNEKTQQARLQACIFCFICCCLLELIC